MSFPSASRNEEYCIVSKIMEGQLSIPAASQSVIMRLSSVILVRKSSPIGFCRSLISAKSGCIFKVSQTHCLCPYHAMAQGISLIVNSSGLTYEAALWSDGG